MTAEYTEDTDGGYFNCWTGRYSPDRVRTLDLYMVWRDDEEVPPLATFRNLTALVVPRELLTAALLAEIRGTGIVSLEVTMLDDESVLPAELFELPQLTGLEVSGAGLAQLPDRFTELPRLTSLKLAHNRLTALPASLLASSLTHLDVSFNALVRAPVFVQGSPLVMLDLTANPIEVLDVDALPRGLCELRAQCDLTEVRGDFTGLASLCGLELGIKLRSLPDLRGLERLTRVQLGGPIGEALFDCLPASLEVLQNYGSHSLGLTRIPPAIGRLTRLHTLKLPLEKIAELAAELLKVPIVQLQLSSNCLADTPSYAYLPDTLQVLQLSNVGMTKWPERFAALTELQTLEVRFNELGEVPAAVRALPRLTTIAVGDRYD